MRKLVTRLLLASALLAWSVAVAAQGAPEVKHGYVRSSDGVRLHYLEAGSGPAIVFVPGWICPTFVWEPQIQYFSKKFHVVAMDMRSQGDSEQTTEGNYPERRAQDVKELIEQLKLAPALVVGHSMGVWDLLAYVDQFGTATLAGVVLVDAPLSGPRRSEEGYAAMIKLINTNRGQLVQQLRPNFFKKPQPPEYFERIQAGVMKTPTNTALALLASATGRDFRPVLGKLDKPVLYAITPALKKDGEMFKSKVPGVRVEVFENSGHVLFVDEAEKFNAVLEEFAGTAFGGRK